jgi:hypothetical protein
MDQHTNLQFANPLLRPVRYYRTYSSRTRFIKTLKGYMLQLKSQKNRQKEFIAARSHKAPSLQSNNVLNTETSLVS